MLLLDYDLSKQMHYLRAAHFIKVKGSCSITISGSPRPPE
jgi:hypothetical protein